MTFVDYVYEWVYIIRHHLAAHPYVYGVALAFIGGLLAARAANLVGTLIIGVIAWVFALTALGYDRYLYLGSNYPILAAGLVVLGYNLYGSRATTGKWLLWAFALFCLSQFWPYFSYQVENDPRTSQSVSTFLAFILIGLIIWAITQYRDRKKKAATEAAKKKN